MKKKTILLVGVLVTTLLLFTACSSATTEENSNEATDSNTKKTVLVASGDGMTLKNTLYSRGDNVTRLVSESTIPYSSVGIDSKEEAEKQLAALNQQYENVSGLKHTITYEEDHALEKLDIDYTKADLEKVAEFTGVKASETNGKDLNLKQTITTMKKAGFEEEK